MVFKKYIIAGLALLLFSQTGTAQNARSFRFFALGDMPYGGIEEELKFQNLIKAINKEDEAFTIHVGDFKSGSSLCSNEYYTRMLGYFGQFKKPMIYTPGDNEWTDCDRPACGSYAPDERLDYLRKHFFADTNSFGRHTLALHSQKAIKGFEKFVENNRWQYQNITFATLHVVGSNNNFKTPAQSNNKEFYERDSANVYWLNETFRQAIANNSTGLVIALQADMFHPSVGNGFGRLLSVLKEQAVAFKKPVLLINGDSHHFLVDQPLSSGNLWEEKTVITNLTRLQVFGEKEVHAVQVFVNPANPVLFEIKPFIVPGN